MTRTHWRLGAAVTTVALAATVTVTASPAEAAQHFSNCTELNQSYPHGVGRPGAVDQTSGAPVTAFKRDRALYEANKGLDRDKDGIACEQGPGGTAAAARTTTKKQTGVQGTASAVELAANGQSSGSGTYQATNFGGGEEHTGTNQPPISVLTGQSLISQGTLNQDAAATNDLKASACAGIAGQGASLVSVGNNRCLNPGSSLALNAGTLDLSKLQLSPQATAQGLPALPGSVTNNQLTDALNSALAASKLNVNANLRAVQANCTSTPTSAAGDSDLTGVSLSATVAGQPTVTLVDLPVKPAPNTPVTVGNAINLVGQALTAQVLAATQQQGGAVATALQSVLTQVQANVTSQLDTGLAPLGQLISGTLNEQTRTGANQIDVKAVHLVIGSGGAALGFQPLDIVLGHTMCGPAERTVSSRVPTAVNSGLAGHVQPSSGLPAWAWGGLVALALGAVAAVAVRLSRTPRRVRVPR